MVMPFLVKDGTVEEGERLDTAWLSRAVSTLVERSKSLVELADALGYYILEYVEFEPKAKEKFINRKNLENLKAVKQALSEADDFSAHGLEAVFKSVMEKLDVKLGAVAQPVRVAVTGRTESPGIFDVLEVLGREKALKRLERAIETIEST
jgi:glutamyl-tRNA synthetase